MAGIVIDADEYGRPVYPVGDVPPADNQKIAVWRDRVVATGPSYSGNSVSGCHAERPYAPCVEGWVPSGAWWLHCADCHPYTPETDAAERRARGFDA